MQLKTRHNRLKKNVQNLCNRSEGYTELYIHIVHENIWACLFSYYTTEITLGMLLHTWKDLAKYASSESLCEGFPVDTNMGLDILLSNMLVWKWQICGWRVPSQLVCDRPVHSTYSQCCCHTAIRHLRHTPKCVKWFCISLPPDRRYHANCTHDKLLHIRSALSTQR